MKRIIITILLIMALFPAGVVMASDNSDANYMATVRVTNNSTAATIVGVPITSVNTTNLINQGFLNASANNSAIRSNAGADVPFMPGYNQDWVMFVESIGANTITDYTWYNNSTGGLIYYFPDTAGMTVSDDASLEVGDNFTITMNDIYLNTANGTDKNIIRKPEAFRTYISDTLTGSITASIYEKSISHDAGNVTFAPVYVAQMTGQTFTTTDSIIITGLNLLLFSRYGTDCGNVTASIRATAAGVPTGANLVSGVRTDIIDSNWYYFDFSSPYTLNAGTVYSIVLYAPGPGQVGWYFSGNTYATGQRVYSTNTGATWTADAAADMMFSVYSVLASTTVTGISSVGHPYGIVSANTTHLTLDIGGTSNSTALGGASVPDNANDWIFFENDSTVYAGATTVTIDGVDISAWEWEYGTTFADSIGSNDATPSFRTVSSDADVSAEFISFRPVSTSIAPAYSVSAAPGFIGDNITVSSNFTTGGAPSAGGRPGDTLIDDAATTAGVPNIWLWGILAIVTIALGGLLISGMIRKYGAVGGEMWLRAGIGLGVIGLLVTFEIFDFWMVIMYIIPAGAVMMANDQKGWNMSVSQLNLIGFLAMTWVGLTMINQIQEAQLITSAETAHLNRLMFTQEFTLLDTFHLPILNFSFFSEGLPALLKWDYAFFGGGGQVIQYFLYSLTAVVSFIVLMITIGTVGSYFTRSS